MLTLVDTGLRIEEALMLTWDSIEFDDLLVCVTGKGRRERRVPMSLDLRRYLYRWQDKAAGSIVFPTTRGRRMDRRDVLRDTTEMCARLEVRAPARTLHALRHTFASNFIRNNGNPLVLQRILGHRTLTMRYVSLMTDDLRQAHVTVLNGGGRSG